MIELIGELFELWARQNWLKRIDQAVDEYNRLNRKARMQTHVVHKLVARYNEIYPENKIDVWRKDGRA